MNSTEHVADVIASWYHGRADAFRWLHSSLSHFFPCPFKLVVLFNFKIWKHLVKLIIFCVRFYSLLVTALITFKAESEHVGMDNSLFRIFFAFCLAEATVDENSVRFVADNHLTCRSLGWSLTETTRAEFHFFPLVGFQVEQVRVVEIPTVSLNVQNTITG